MDLSDPKILLLGPLLAITLHELLLRRVEVDHLALPIIATACLAFVTLAFKAGFVTASLVASSFWVPLWLYIGTYRFFFHPLRIYPGPFGARLSKWWTVKQNWDTNLHFHRAQQRLQKEYGDYVRTGKSRVHGYEGNLTKRRPERAHYLRGGCYSDNSWLTIKD
jgi:hypothetical protein